MSPQEGFPHDPLAVQSPERVEERRADLAFPKPAGPAEPSPTNGGDPIRPPTAEQDRTRLRFPLLVEARKHPLTGVPLRRQFQRLRRQRLPRRPRQRAPYFTVVVNRAPATTDSRREGLAQLDVVAPLVVIGR